MTATEREFFELIEQAFEQAPLGRLAWLEARCAGDRQLFERAVTALERGAKLGAALPTELPDAARTSLADFLVPERIGPYRLCEQIGAGGMGLVFRAERDDQLFSQVVAIKLLPAAIQSVALSQYFERERQILADIRHPHIAQLFDGGRTERGLSYIVMEYLQGESITECSQKRQLDLADRLRLFRQVCDAVEHAHRNLVLHRDIKPSNILVSSNGDAKLLDFGIASRLDMQGSAGNLAEAMTLDYASPNRLELRSASIADDIYSLGVVLFELLCDQRPYDFTGMARVAAIEAIRASYPRLTLRPAVELTRLQRIDLQAIIGKALQPDESRRYGSVAQLADDLERMRTLRAISARGRDASNTWMKFVARNRVASAAVSIAVLALIGGLVGTALSRQRAERERTVAQARFDQVREAARIMLFDLFERLESVPGSTGVRRDLAASAQRYLDSLRAGARDNIELAVEAAAGYARLAEVQGSPTTAHLGDTEGMLRNQSLAYALLKEVLDREPRHPRARFELAKLQLQRGVVAVQVQEDATNAESLAKEAATLLADPGVTTLDPVVATYVQLQLATLQAEIDLTVGRYDDAIRVTEKALAAEPAIAIPSEQALRIAEARARLYAALGDATYYAGRPRDAPAIYLRGIDAVEAVLQATPERARTLTSLARSYWSLASTYDDIGEAERALVYTDKGLALTERASALDPSDNVARRTRGILRLQRAGTFSSLRRHREAIAVARAALAEREQWRAERPTEAMRARDVAVALRPVGDIYRASGDARTACEMYARAEQTWHDYAEQFVVTPFDRDGEIKRVAALVAACADRTTGTARTR